VLPSWCRSVPGAGPALVIAPHGGLCARDLLVPDPAQTLRGNDLHTAAVAESLAERLGASLLANVAADRNGLDLNRIDDVRARAPWFLDAIVEHLEPAVARHGRVLVLIVHGWQIVQPCCDVGVGARLEHAADATSRAARLTVSPGFVTTTLESFRAANMAHGVQTTYGVRWPARHPNNVMQLFRRTPDAAVAAAVPPRLAALAARGCIEAVQLELGAPLRYPGVWRERFLAAASAAFAGRGAPGRTVAAAYDAGAPAPEPADASRAADRPASPRGVALQAFDAACGDDGLGVVVGLGVMSPRELGARLLLFPGGQRMLLFTGHERLGPGANDRVGGLEARPCAGGLAVRFRGPVLDVPDASGHFRFEAAQLDARVLELELDLRFAAQGGSGYGAVTGRIRADGVTWQVRAHGFTDPVLARPVASRGSLRLTAAFGGALGVTAELAPAHASRVRLLTPDGVREHGVAEETQPVAIAPGRLAPAFALRADGGPLLRCAPLGHVTILRPGPGGRPQHVTFGAARFALDDGTHGGGFYEHGAPVARAGEDAEEGRERDGDDRSAQ
jgi:hypothetical protein